MQYNRYSNGWSYNKNNNVNFIKVTNDEGKDMILTSVSVYCGAGVGTISKPYSGSDAVSSTTRSFTMSLVSGSITSSTQTINTVCNVVTSSSGYQEYSTSAPIQYTFSFGEGITMSAGSSITFTYNKSGGVLVCPKENKRSVTGTAKEAYSEPNRSYNSVSPIYGALDETIFTSDYSITGGTNGIHWTSVRIYNSNGAYKNSIDLNNTSKGNNIKSTFKLDSGNYSDGTEYKTAIRFSDYKWEHETGTKNIYTYRTPRLSGVSVNPSSFSGTGNATLNWNTNGRRWTEANEANFTTRFKFNTNGTEIDPSNNNPNEGDTSNELKAQSITITKSMIDNSFTAKQRSLEKISTKVTVIRKNPTSGKSVSLETTSDVTIQFWPKYEISTLSYTDPNKNNIGISAGTTQYIDILPKIRANWTYTSNADKGIIDGYILRIYRADQKTQVGSDYKVEASTTYLDFDTKKNLQRGELNYIKIIPYYDLPSGGVKEGPSTIKQFILPLGRIKKPVISYPIANTTWHNKNFRILLQCPIDDDFDTYNLNKEDYRYEDIELYIEGPNFSTTYSYKKNGTIFSSASIYHERKIIINPSIITSFPDLSYYKFKIRFQKKYYQNTWSEWSDIIQVNKSNITELTLKQYEKVLQSEYKTVRDYSIRLWNVYHKSTESYDSNNKANSKGDIIYAKHYLGIYNTILAIYNRVNDWGDCDSNRSNIKFTQTITNMSGLLVPTKGELITSSKVSNEPAGRNYKNILIECMNKLY